MAGKNTGNPFELRTWNRKQRATVNHPRINEMYDRVDITGLIVQRNATVIFYAGIQDAVWISVPFAVLLCAHWRPLEIRHGERDPNVGVGRNSIRITDRAEE